ncbi:hypothetical protein GW17_00032725 [Ensete ventricosum]|nr:hypothetical protein GW17_00032725 [Ensete ventricosum]
MVTRPSRRPASDNWPVDVADPMREASRAQVWGRQRSYGRPDAGKADTLTCRRMPYRKDSGHGGSVRQHDKPQGQPGCQVRMIYNTHYISSCTTTGQGDRKNQPLN